MDKKIEVNATEYAILKSQSKLYSELKRALLEYVGYEAEYLTTEKTIKKFTKGEMVELLMIKRQMIRSLFEQLPENIQKETKDEVEDLLRKV